MTVGRFRFSVIIATYRRPSALLQCLNSLLTQQLKFEEIIVTVRDVDSDTQVALSSRPADGLPLRIVVVQMPGIVAARNAGLEVVTGDLVAFLDDDTVAHPDWSERALEHFASDSRLGGLGGKDRLHDGKCFNDRKSNIVGHISWFGRIVPNQHLGYGASREVDMLKGANMIFRRSAIGNIRFDTRLRGTGAQPNDDVAFCLAIRRAKWKLVYDPSVLVDHYSGRRDEVRHYVEIDKVVDRQGFKDLAYNDVVALWDELPRFRHLAFGLWSVLVGTSICPGLLQAIRFTPRLGWASWERLVLAQQGKLEAWRALRLDNGSLR